MRTALLASARSCSWACTLHFVILACRHKYAPHVPPLRAAEGVITVEKKSAAPKHHVLDMPNIHVMDALKSLKSKGFVTETFNWFVRDMISECCYLCRRWQQHDIGRSSDTD